MAFIALKNACVDYPVYGADASSLRVALTVAATGGRIKRNTNAMVVQALRDITLELKDGDRLGVVGHNGSGKTTLLRLIAGAYPPTGGSYSRDGTLSCLIDPTLGMEPDATGYENILLRGLVMGLTRTEIAAHREQIINFSGLGDYLAMPIAMYSTGMLMRLAFSITTAVPTNILLMDEWLSVGDQGFQRHAEQRLQAVVGQAGILVLASHSLELVRRECNRVIELSHGAVVSDTLI